MAKQRGQKKLNGFSMVDRRNLTCSLVLTLALMVAGCGGIPPVDTSTISRKAASPTEFGKAERAVRICANLPDAEAMFRGFEAVGYREHVGPYRSLRQELPNGQTRFVVPSVSYDSGQLIIQANEQTCYVGLRSMTPEQNFELAQIWARHYDLATNSELGQGLSDHVVQAWQAKSYPSSSTLVAAYKTWPWDRGKWPKDEPGAAVTLRVN